MVKRPKRKQQESKGNNRKLLQESKGYFDTPNDQIKHSTIINKQADCF